MNPEIKRKKWREIEASIKTENPEERDLEWGRLRQEFYDKYGPIDLPEEDARRLGKLKDAYKGERIFIIGNGPSINKTPLDLLKNEYTFGVNRIYLLYDRIEWKPTFYTALDWRVVPDVAREINGLTGSTFFFEERFRGILREGEDVYYYTHTGADPNFPEEKLFTYDVSRGVRGAGSVVGTAIQLAFHMGFDPIYLIGCDLGYKVLDSVQQDGEDKFGTGVRLELTSTKDDDPNHFDGRYFGKGRKWHDPNVKRMVEGHIQCKNAIEKQGRKIYNATIGGELEVYQRVQFESLFKTESFRKFSRDEHANIDETQIVSELYKDLTNGVMLDVGAHHGNSAKHFVDFDWKIYCFEPDSNNRDFLVRRLGAKKNIVIDSRAVGDTQAKNRPYYNSVESSGISGMLAFHHTHKQAGVVDVVTIADILKEYAIDKIDFLKIDVEGFDFSVLKGVPWAQITPDVVECEFEDAKTKHLGHTWRDICEFLAEKGYVVYVSEWHPIVRYGIRHDWLGLKRYPCELEDPNAWGNLLAFKKEPSFEAIEQAINNVLSLKKSIKSDKISKPQNNNVAINSAKLSTVAPNSSQKSTNFNSQRKKFNKIANLLSQLSSYSKFAQFIQRKNLTLHRIGQFVMWVVRLNKRHPKLFVFGLVVLISLVMTPIFSSQLASQKIIFWIVAGFIVVVALFGMAVSFVNMKLMEFTARGFRDQQLLKAEIMGELRKESISLTKRIEKLEMQSLEITKNFNSRFNQLKGLGENITELQSQEEILTQSNKKLSARLDELCESEDKQIKLYDALIIKLDEIHNNSEKLNQLQEKLTEEVGKQGKDLFKNHGKLEEKVNHLIGFSSVFNGSDFQHFNRKLTKDHIKILQNEWFQKLELDVPSKALAYLAHRICVLEYISKGRLATPIEDAVLRVLVASAAKSNELKVVEIGTLFGIGMSAIYDYVRSRFESVHLTAIDPLDGFYDRSSRDIVTNEAINEENFRSNLLTAGVPEKDYTLIKAKSTDKKAIEQVTKTNNKYDVLIIDGDHSYTGVKADFENYHTVIKQNGFIIFDDFNAPEWPEVKEYVESIAQKYSNVELVGASWRTAVFRVL